MALADLLGRLGHSDRPGHSGRSGRSAPGRRSPQRFSRRLRASRRRSATRRRRAKPKTTASSKRRPTWALPWSAAAGSPAPARSRRRRRRRRRSSGAGPSGCDRACASPAAAAGCPRGHGTTVTCGSASAGDPRTWLSTVGSRSLPPNPSHGAGWRRCSEESHTPQLTQHRPDGKSRGLGDTNARNHCVCDRHDRHRGSTLHHTGGYLGGPVPDGVPAAPVRLDRRILRRSRGLVPVRDGVAGDGRPRGGQLAQRRSDPGDRRLRVREWEQEGRTRTSVEIDARSVGHDLARGSSRFARRVRPVEEGAGRARDAGPAESDAAPSPSQRGGCGGGRLNREAGEPAAGEEAPVGAAGGRGPHHRGLAPTFGAAVRVRIMAEYIYTSARRVEPMATRPSWTMSPWRSCPAPRSEWSAPTAPASRPC